LDGAKQKESIIPVCGPLSHLVADSFVMRTLAALDFADFVCYTLCARPHEHSGVADESQGPKAICTTSYGTMECYRDRQRASPYCFMGDFKVRVIVPKHRGGIENHAR
jgi:hypothetical protein